MTKDTLIGKGLLRVDAAEKVTGMAEYTNDLDLFGVLDAELLTSPYAYARIRSIDVSRALSLDGVVAVVTGNDVKGLYGPVVKDRPVLAQGRCSFCG